MDPNIKQSIIDRLKQTNNVLVTVKSSPTVDQLAACIGLTLFLNKQGKHATAVFSGEVPSTIEFLKPDATLEKDTNSLRDFIIALDKSKADKLRYKVEDKVVKIFITPYRTSLSQADLDFSQGDFNVDVVIALGVHAREELDQAIIAHGRILHDATVVSINNTKAADLGALNWNDPQASSLSEMIAGLVDTMQANSLDSQMATAFLTGIVAETGRFSNPKTTSLTMSISAKLMAAGANQQLVATKLQEPHNTTSPATPESGPKKPDGTLEIEHASKPDAGTELPQPVEEHETSIHIDDNGNLKTGLQDHSELKASEDSKDTKDGSADEGDSPKHSRLALDPPTMGGTLTANSQTGQLDPSTDPLSGKSANHAVLSRDSEQSVVPKESSTPKARDVIAPSQTLSSIEEQVDSPHADKPPTTDLSSLSASGIEDARKAVESAAQASMDAPLDPLHSINAQPLGGQLNTPLPQPGMPSSPADTPLPPANLPATPAPTNLPPNLVPPNSPLPPEQTGTSQAPTPPPPVPPPLPPSNFMPPNQNGNGDSGIPM